MRKRIYRGEWAGSSHYSERIKEMEANKVSSEELKKMLDKYEVAHASVKHRRPRIANKPKEVIVSVFGNQIKMSLTDYELRGNGLTIVTRIW